MKQIILLILLFISAFTYNSNAQFSFPELKKTNSLPKIKGDDAENYYQIGWKYLEMSSNAASFENELNYLIIANENFLKARELNPNYFLSYCVALTYFNLGALLNNEINKFGGSIEEVKKSREYEKLRDQYFSNSIPYFLATKKAYEQTGIRDLNPKDMSYYKTTINALKEIYALQDNLEEYNKMKAILETL